jgi:dTDP-4-amino-4,6-dideoxygalactose transaminase
VVLIESIACVLEFGIFYNFFIISGYVTRISCLVALPKIPMEVQLFVPSFHVDECLQEIRECLEKGWPGLGFKTIAFEEAWKKYSNFPYAHFVNSGTAGLHLAVSILKKRLNWQEGDEVITTPITFVSTNHVILYEKLKPVFADVDNYICLNPDDVVKKIGKRTRAIIFVGLGGNLGQYEKIIEICRQSELALILDAAHMSGTRKDGQQVGKEADASIFSFHAVKNLPTADSGMICFRLAEDDAVARKLTWLGIDKDTYTRTISTGFHNKWMYDVEDIGFKYHGNSIMAAIALVQLKYLDQENEYRRNLADCYTSALKECNTIQIIPMVPGCESSRHLFQILVNDRKNLIAALNRNGVFPGVHYRDNTEYSMYRYARGTCPYAHEISKKLLSLPMHLRMTKSDAERVAELLIEHTHK